MSKTTNQLFHSYAQGFAKSMDIQNAEKIFSDISPATIKSSWKNVGLELSDSMKNLQKSVETESKIKHLDEKLAEQLEALNTKTISNKMVIDDFHEKFTKFYNK